MDGIITLITLLLCALPVYSLQCKFALGSYSYDICPLIFAANNPSAGRVIRVQQDQQASPTAKRTIYDIDLAGDGLIYDRSLPSSQQCPEGTWVCMKVLSDLASDVPEVLQALPLAGNIQYEDFRGEVNAAARLITPNIESGIPSLEIVLKGGYYLSQSQSVQFLLNCDEDVQEPTLPIIKGADSITMMRGDKDVYTHVFTWTSRHACPIERDTSPTPPFSWWTSFFTDETPQEESSGLRPNKGKTAGVIIGSIAGACVLLGGVYYLQSRRSKAYDMHSISESFVQWLNVPVSYLQQIPLPPISLSSIRSFVTKPFARNSSRQYRYNPLFAEEYEIQDGFTNDDEAVVDLQRQQTAPRIKSSRGNMGYGSI